MTDKDVAKLTHEEKKMLKSGEWILCLVSRIDCKDHEHEIIHPIGTKNQIGRAHV
jgi:hypothetical protein